MSAGRYSLSLVMIVKDEARCLARCLDSVRAWVDEMVVVDTGSQDGTPVIAQQGGARLAHFPWCDDFSAARNAALALTQADWRLVLDADETLQQGHTHLLWLREQAPDWLGSIEVVSGFGADGLARASSWLPRLLPRQAHYEGRVHEQPQFEGPRKRLPVQVAHDGYLAAQMQGKQDRNRVLLELALRDEPGNAYLHYQLGKDHEVHQRLSQAWPAYQTALQLLGPAATRSPAWRHDLILRSLYVLKASARMDQAMALAQQEMANWPDSPDFFFVLGDVLLDQAVAHPELAAQLVPMMGQAWQRCLAIGENPSLEGSVSGRGSELPRRQLEALKRLFPL